MAPISLQRSTLGKTKQDRAVADVFWICSICPGYFTLGHRCCRRTQDIPSILSPRAGDSRADEVVDCQMDTRGLCSLNLPSWNRVGREHSGTLGTILNGDAQLCSFYFSFLCISSLPAHVSVQHVCALGPQRPDPLKLEL